MLKKSAIFCCLDPDRAEATGPEPENADYLYPKTGICLQSKIPSVPGSLTQEKIADKSMIKHGICLQFAFPNYF
jgi:hypothetical protein